MALIAGCTGGSDRTSQTRSDSIPILEELRIGSLTGSEAYAFGSVGPLTPGHGGRLYVSDIQVPVIRAFDAAGRYTGDIGGRGEGPGEYMSVAAMRVLVDGRLLVWDEGSQRVSWFDSTGTFRDSRPLRAHGRYDDFVIASDGTVYTPVEGGRPRPADPIEIVGYWTRVAPDGGTERLRALALVEAEGPSYVLAGRGGYYRPFTVMTLAAMGPDGSYYEVRNDTYRIRHVHPDGRETFITRDEPRVALSPEEMEEWETRSEDMARQFGGDRSSFLPIPPVKPYIRYLKTDLDGRLWVSRYTEAVYMPYSESEAADREAQGRPPFNWRDRADWDVYTADDEYLGTVTLPHRTTLVTARGDEIWAIQAGEFREDYVVRYRMVGAMLGSGLD